MPAHQDVAGVVERLRKHSTADACDCGYGKDSDRLHNEAAALIESLSKALSEAEAEADKYCGWWREKRNECMAAESRLAEAMKVIEPLVVALEDDCIGEVCRDEEPNEPVGLGEDGPTAVTFGMIYAARRFLNAGKE